QRHGDRGSGDDNGQPGVLPIYVRYVDLVAAGIVRSWTQLVRLIDDKGFPAGQLLSPNIRAWRLDLVERWLSARPGERKPVPDAWPKERREAAEKKRAAQQRADANDAPAPVSR